jgi:hypothetical protein
MADNASKNAVASGQTSSPGSSFETVFPNVFTKYEGSKEGTVSNINMSRFIQSRPESKATLYLMDSVGADKVAPIRNFLLTGLSWTISERVQVMEMYEGLDVTFLGERPVTVSFTMDLYNTANLNWRDQWMYMWDNYIRGSQCVRNGWRSVVMVDNLVIEGLFLSYQFQQSAGNDMHVPISVSMLTGQEKIYPLQLFGTMNSTEKDTIPSNLGQTGKDMLAYLNQGTGNVYFASENGGQITGEPWTLRSIAAAIDGIFGDSDSAKQAELNMDVESMRDTSKDGSTSGTTNVSTPPTPPASQQANVVEDSSGGQGSSVGTTPIGMA